MSRPPRKGVETEDFGTAAAAVTVSGGGDKAGKADATKAKPAPAPAPAPGTTSSSFPFSKGAARRMAITRSNSFSFASRNNGGSGAINTKIGGGGDSSTGTIPTSTTTTAAADANSRDSGNTKPKARKKLSRPPFASLPTSPAGSPKEASGGFGWGRKSRKRSPDRAAATGKAKAKAKGKAAAPEEEIKYTKSLAHSMAFAPDYDDMESERGGGRADSERGGRGLPPPEVGLIDFREDDDGASSRAGSWVGGGGGTITPVTPGSMVSSVVSSVSQFSIIAPSSQCSGVTDRSEVAVEEMMVGRGRVELVGHGPKSPAVAAARGFVAPAAGRDRDRAESFLSEVSAYSGASGVSADRDHHQQQQQQGHAARQLHGDDDDDEAPPPYSESAVIEVRAPNCFPLVGRGYVCGVCLFLCSSGPVV